MNSRIQSIVIHHVYPAATIGFLVTLLSAGLAFAEDDLNCGLDCLYVASVALDQEIPYDDLRAALGKRANNGYSMAQLQTATQAVGFKTMLVQTNAKELVARKSFNRFACIAWLPREHFVVIAEADQGTYTVINGLKKSRMQHGTFEQQWAGDALLVSTEELVPSEKLNRSLSRYLIAGLLAFGVCGLGLFGVAVLRKKK